MIVELAGDIDLSVIVAVRSAFHEAINDGWNRVVVDLGDVTFLDSAALGVLIGLHRRCRQANGACVLVNPRANVAHLLSLTGLDTVFEIATDIEMGCAVAQSVTAEASS